MIIKSRLILASLCIAFLIISSASAQSVKLPETKPGQLAAEWLQSCLSPNLEQSKKWAASHYSERALSRFGATRIATSEVEDCMTSGGYRPFAVTESSEERLVLLVVSNKTDIWSSLHFRMNPDQKLVPIWPMPAIPPESVLPKDLSDSSLSRVSKAYVARLGSLKIFSGVALIARGIQPIASATAGYADLTKKTGFTLDSQFTIGSMGKMFTAAAIGQLVDQGKLSFDDTVGKIFPDFPNKTIREKATVAMLLSHTSGMGDFLGKRTPEMMTKGVKRAAEFMPLYNKDEPQFEPGKGWTYSNAGLALAGAIVEKVSGETYPDYIRRHIFEPVGMKNSDPNNIPHTTPTLVTPYTHAGENSNTAKLREAEHDIGSPAGGAISTARDLMLFADALRTGKLVSSATFKKMISTQSQTPSGGYGYAMEIADYYGRTTVGHGGGFPGVSTHLYIVLNSPYTVVALANQDPPAAEIVGQRLAAMAAEKAKQGK